MRADDLSRPRIKPEYVPYRTVDGTIRIGADVHGLGVEIQDPAGWVWVLLKALDGTRSPEQVYATVDAAHAGAPAAAALQQLSDAGFLEDDPAAVSPPLSDREEERYSRGMALLRWMDRSTRPSPWDIQLRLRESRVLLVGVGSVGGVVARGLVASGLGQLHCVDFDLVELSNLNRHVLFGEADLGQPKVDAAVRCLRRLNSDVTVTGERARISEPADIAALLPGYDLLALCADQPRMIRRWANRACLAAGTPWVVAGYHGPVVAASFHARGAAGCWECMHDIDAEQADTRMPPGMVPDDLAPPLPWHPANAVSAGLAGALLTHFAVAALTGAPPVEPGARWEMNLVTMESSAPHRAPRRPGCPGCGRLR